MKEKKDLSEYRSMIDLLDEKISDLLKKRIDLSESVAEYKEQNGIEIFDAKREEEKYKKIAADFPSRAEDIREIYRSVLRVSKNVQNRRLHAFGLVGKELSHSFSPIIHRHFGYEYRLYEIPPEELFTFIRCGQYSGLNVTIPYKESVIPYLDELSPSAKAVGAVNTIVRRDGMLIGHNTDIDGFSALLARSGIEVKGKKCAVLGSGGASKAVQYVLQRSGAAEIYVISRSGKLNYGNLELVSDAQILVNATPVGMYPNSGECPVNIDVFRHLDALFDLIYRPEKTELILCAKERNIPAYSGGYMLVYQAKKSAELFLGKQIDDNSIEKIYSEIFEVR